MRLVIPCILPANVPYLAGASKIHIVYVKSCTLKNVSVAAAEAEHAKMRAAFRSADKST
jgi:hypothetical protein